jgi:hypothetical protein
MKHFKMIKGKELECSSSSSQLMDQGERRLLRNPGLSSQPDKEEILIGIFSLPAFQLNENVDKSILTNVPTQVARKKFVLQNTTLDITSSKHIG